jgi:ribonuclease HII
VIAGATQSFNFVADDAGVCRVDEAGRGPLAGAVVAAAVILDRSKPIEGPRDFGPCAIHRATFAPVREVGAEYGR